MKILTPSIELEDSYFEAILNHSEQNGISSEQMASQIVIQWIANVLEPNKRGKHKTTS